MCRYLEVVNVNNGFDVEILNAGQCLVCVISEIIDVFLLFVEQMKRLSITPIYSVFARLNLKRSVQCHR